MTTLTTKTALETYESTRRAIDNIARSRKSTDKQKAKAKAARRKLALDFIQKQRQEIEARTDLFASFILEMEKLIKSIGKDSPIAALKTLDKIVKEAKTVVEEE